MCVKIYKKIDTLTLENGRKPFTSVFIINTLSKKVNKTVN